MEVMENVVIVGAGLATSHRSDHEFRYVNRKVLMGTMEKELPKGTIWYSSKVVQIQDSGSYNSIHLADGKTKVLIGCDGVNYVVAKYQGLSKPCFVGRSTIRGFFEFRYWPRGMFITRRQCCFGYSFGRCFDGKIEWCETRNDKHRRIGNGLEVCQREEVEKFLSCFNIIYGWFHKAK